MQDVDGNPHQALQWLVEYGNPVMILGSRFSPEQLLILVIHMVPVLFGQYCYVLLLLVVNHM